MKGFNTFLFLLLFQFFVIILAFSFYILLILNNSILRNTKFINTFQNSYSWLANSLQFIFIISLFVSLFDSYYNASYLKALSYLILFLSFGYLYALTQNTFVTFFNASQNIFLNSTMKETFQNSYAFIFNKNYGYLTFIVLAFNVLLNLYFTSVKHE